MRRRAIVAMAIAVVGSIRVPDTAPIIIDAANRHEDPPRTTICPPLAPVAGSIMRVTPDQAGRLSDIVASAPANSVILLADGIYRVDRGLQFGRPNVTMRALAAQEGRSHDSGRVVIDGASAREPAPESTDHRIPELVAITASGVTIADLTLRNARDHLIHVQTPGREVAAVRIYNMRLTDPGEQAIKINPTPGAGVYADQGEVACSNIDLTDAGRAKVDHRFSDGCYTGGIDAHQARGWRFAGNTITGFWCEQGLSEHAIHIWKGSRDTLIENNRIVNSARAIGLGMGRNDPSWRNYSDGVCGGKRDLGHYRGIVRNNTVLVNDRRLAASRAGADVGISVEGGCEAAIVNNTVLSMFGFRSSAIEWRFSTTVDVLVANNLTNGRVGPRDGANGALRNNVTDALADWFRSVDGNGDLHLSRPIGSVVRGGAVLDTVTVDGDGFPRDGVPDVGAYQYRSR